MQGHGNMLGVAATETDILAFRGRGAQPTHVPRLRGRISARHARLRLVRLFDRSLRARHACSNSNTTSRRGGTVVCF